MTGIVECCDRGETETERGEADITAMVESTRNHRGNGGLHLINAHIPVRQHRNRVSVSRTLRLETSSCVSKHIMGGPVSRHVYSGLAVAIIAHTLSTPHLFPSTEPKSQPCHLPLTTTPPSPHKAQMPTNSNRCEPPAATSPTTTSPPCRWCTVTSPTQRLWASCPSPQASSSSQSWACTPAGSKPQISSWE